MKKRGHIENILVLLICEINSKIKLSHFFRAGQSKTFNMLMTIYSHWFQLLALYSLELETSGSSGLQLVTPTKKICLRQKVNP